MVKEKIELRASVDKALAERVRAAAADMNVSVSMLIRNQLLGFLEAQESTAGSSNNNFRILAEFSLGTRPAGTVMNLLSLHSYQDLLDLLTAARLPKPVLPEEHINMMVRELKSLAQW